MRPVEETKYLPFLLNQRVFFFDSVVLKSNLCADDSALCCKVSKNRFDLQTEVFWVGFIVPLSRIPILALETEPRRTFLQRFNVIIYVTDFQVVPRYRFRP